MTSSRRPRGGGASAPRGRSRAYHHGDLRSALLASALEILQREGIEGLTLRAVARAAGVSQSAPYRHFADRRQLMAGVAAQGFRAMEQAMLAEMQRTPDAPRLGLKMVAVAYVKFGLANPALYRVMFGPEVANTEDLPELRETGRGVLGFVSEGIRRLQEAGLVGPGDPWLMAVTTWSTLHGLVMLTLDGQTHGVAPSLEALLDEATRIMMFGMAGRSSSA
ncbi:MAG: TetR/AcrR family transcriptional regulator [Gemmatimonadaceae bacterium]